MLTLETTVELWGGAEVEVDVEYEYWEGGKSTLYSPPMGPEVEIYAIWQRSGNGAIPPDALRSVDDLEEKCMRHAERMAVEESYTEGDMLWPEEG
jgi:hypothetical protein